MYKRLLIGVVIVLVVVLGFSIFSSNSRPLITEHQPLVNNYQLPVTSYNLPDTDLPRRSRPKGRDPVGTGQAGFVDIWHPRPVSGLTTPGAEVQAYTFNLQLTGTIIEPDFSAAFILDTKAFKESLYYESDSVCGWVVEKISRNQVVLCNSDNKRIVLPLLRQQASSGPKLPPTDKPAQGFYTPAGLDNLLRTTSLDTALNLARRLPEGTVESILDKLPQGYLRDKLALTELGLSIEDLQGVKPSKLIASLLKVAQAEIGSGGAPLYFTTQVNSLDNSPVKSGSVFKNKDYRIYACFLNQGALAKLDSVIVYWANTSKNQIVYWGCQPINPNASYNYIWVEEKSGWARGTYLVALFKHAKDKDCLAQGKFKVK